MTEVSNFTERRHKINDVMSRTVITVIKHLSATASNLISA